MNHSAAVCRQCSKTYTDISDGQPYCAVCLLTTHPAVNSSPLVCMRALERLHVYASDMDDRQLLAAIDDVSAWLMGQPEKPSSTELIIRALFDLHRHPDDATWGDAEIEESLGLLVLLTGVVR